MPEQIRGLPLPLRKKYLTQMYPGLSQADIDSKIKSLQQRQVFTLFYGFECEPMSNADIRNELGINSHNQVAVQLERAERKLGLDKDKRYELLKVLRKEYYKKHRPKCPFCKASKAQSRGSTDSEDKWSCGRCKRHYRTLVTEGTLRDGNEIVRSSQRVNINFRLGNEGLVSHLVVKVDGSYKAISGSLRAVVGDEDWNLKLGATPLDEATRKNDTETLILTDV